MMILWPSGQPVASTPLTDEQIVALLVEELRAVAATNGPAILALPPDALFRLVAMVQLASRCTGVSPYNLEAAAQIVDSAREYFSSCPTVMEIINRGDDTAFDRARDDAGG